jgi:hypothetical protein
MFRRRQKLRQALHDWNQKARSVARKVLQRERSVR